MRIIAAAAIATSLSCVCLPALADKVPAPPADCPDGSTAATGHGGPYCRPKSCGATAPCKDGTVCQARALCVGEVVGGGRRRENVPPPRYPSVVTRCDKADGSACSLPADAGHRYWGVKEGTCQTLTVCVAADLAAPPSKSTAEPDKTAPKPDEKPTTVSNKPPCSCAGSPADLSITMIGAVMLWWLVRRRARA